MTRGTGKLEGYLARERIKIVKTLIKDHPNPTQILDIGCGNDTLLLNALEIKEKHGIDPNLLFTKDNLIKTEIRRTLPYPNDYFDIIVMSAVLEHLEEPDQLLYDTKFKLKPSGLLIITTPSPSSKPLLEAMAALNIVSPEEIREHKKYYSQKTLLETLTKAGYDPNRIKIGSFEFSLNNYATARKEDVSNV